MSTWDDEELEQLRAWKAEALQSLNGWHEIADIAARAHPGMFVLGESVQDGMRRLLASIEGLSTSTTIWFEAVNGTGDDVGCAYAVSTPVGIGMARARSNVEAFIGKYPQYRLRVRRCVTVIGRDIWTTIDDPMAALG